MLNYIYTISYLVLVCILLQFNYTKALILVSKMCYPHQNSSCIPHVLTCDNGGSIFITSACEDICSLTGLDEQSNTCDCPKDKCKCDDSSARFDDVELERLYTSCALKSGCTFPVPKTLNATYRHMSGYSVIEHSCKDSVYNISAMINTGINSTVKEFLFYYGGTTTDTLPESATITCIITPSGSTILYRNWINIAQNSETQIQFLSSDFNDAYSAGNTVYRNIRHGVMDPVELVMRFQPAQSDRVSLGITSQDPFQINCTSNQNTTGSDTGTILSQNFKYGIAAGGGCLLFILIVLCVCIYRRRNKQPVPSLDENEHTTEKDGHTNEESPKIDDRKPNIPTVCYEYTTPQYVHYTDSPKIKTRVSSRDITFDYATAGEFIRMDTASNDMELDDMRVKPVSNHYSTPCDSIEQSVAVKKQAKSEYAEPCTAKECLIPRFRANNSAKNAEPDEYTLVCKSVSSNDKTKGDNSTHANSAYNEENDSEDAYNLLNRHLPKQNLDPDSTYTHM